MAKIIRFPEKNDKMSSVKKANQKALLFISLSSIILFAIVFNFSYQTNGPKSTRDIANVQSIKEAENKTSALNDWILTNLNSSSTKNEVVFSEQVSAKDDLLFASLIGRYDVVKSKSLITELNLKPGSEPVKPTDLPHLLNQYRKANGIESLEFKLVDSKPLEYIYEMRVSSQKRGTLRLEFSEGKGLLSIKSRWN